MKKIVLFVTLAMSLFLFTNPAWSYTANVGWAWFGDMDSSYNGHPVYDINHNLFYPQDFSTGAPVPMSPPYFYVNNPNGNSMSLSDGKLQLTPSSPSVHVGATFPNYNSSGIWQDMTGGTGMSGVKLGLNYQGGPPALGYSFGININSSNRNEYISLGIGTISGMSGIAFETPGHTMDGGNPLYFGSLSDYTSLGLVLRIFNNGDVYAKYLIDPANGALSTTSTGVHGETWQALTNGGSEVIGHVDVSWLQRTDLNAGFGTGSTDVPEPSTMAVLGLVGAYFGYRRRKKTDGQI